MAFFKFTIGTTLLTVAFLNGMLSRTQAAVILSEDFTTPYNPSNPSQTRSNGQDIRNTVPAGSNVGLGTMLFPGDPTKQAGYNYATGNTSSSSGPYFTPGSGAAGVGLNGPGIPQQAVYYSHLSPDNIGVGTYGGTPLPGSYGSGDYQNTSDGGNLQGDSTALLIDSTQQTLRLPGANTNLPTTQVLKFTTSNQSPNDVIDIPLLYKFDNTNPYTAHANTDIVTITVTMATRSSSSWNNFCLGFADRTEPGWWGFEEGLIFNDTSIFPTFHMTTTSGVQPTVPSINGGNPLNSNNGTSGRFPVGPNGIAPTDFAYVHTISLSYDPTTPGLGTVAGADPYRLSIDGNIIQFSGGGVFQPLTAIGGISFGNYGSTGIIDRDILSWSLSTPAPVPEPSSIVLRTCLQKFVL